MVVVLEAILKVVVEAEEMRCLSFFIWVFLYCRNVFSLLLKMVFCRFVKVGSSSVLVQRCLCVSNFSLEMVDQDISTLDSIVDEWMFSFLYYALFKLTGLSFELQGFWCYLKSSPSKKDIGKQFSHIKSVIFFKKYLSFQFSGLPIVHPTRLKKELGSSENIS